MTDTSARIVLFDEDCGLCRLTVDRLLALDRSRRLRAVPLQSEEAVRLLPGVDDADRLGSWHVVTADGRVHSAGDAVAPVLRALPCGAPLAAVADRLPGPTEAAYRFVARHRTRIGSLLGRERCAVDPVGGRDAA